MHLKFFQHTNLRMSSHMSRVKHSLHNKVMHMCCKWVQMGSCREGQHLVWALVLVLALALVQELEQHWSLLELQPAVQTETERIHFHVGVNKGVDFYMHGSMHHDSVLIRSNKMQQDARIYLLQVYMFRAFITPIIRNTKKCNCSLWYRS